MKNTILQTLKKRTKFWVYSFFGAGGMDGDKTIEKSVFWVIRTDALGSKTGKNVYNGNAPPMSIVKTNDGGYLM
jgi:hypothetical protein